MKRIYMFIILYVAIFSTFIACSSKSGQLSFNKSVSTQEFSTWAGTYTFNEFYEPNINIAYELIITQENGNYYGLLNVDGFQTLIRAKTTIKGQENHISIIMEKYFNETLYKPYKNGEILFSILKEGQIIKTEWGVIKPISSKNNLTGETGFVKTE